ncbi:exodeoxyribonuclease VII large subunit [Thermaurantiacus sp.]
MADAPPNIPEYSVSEISQSVRRTLENAFGLVRVRGEISGFKVYASGHGYFDLKDRDAVLAAVMWKGQLARLSFRPEDGLEVIATGRLTAYARNSKYQLQVERMEVAGIGALLAQVEERRQRLAAEGLFAPERKRPLPFLPRRIGVITSPQGAVIRDILHRLADRFPRDVLLWPVPVQGEGAEARVAAAIRGMNALPESERPDLLIVARGGGSVEDLMAFNAEAVVRAAADSVIPLISAVGHETDTTLIDFAADHRAPTPTAAAERAVPVRAELLERVAGLGLRLMQAERKGRDRARERLQALAARLPRSSSLVDAQRQRLDEAGERLPRALTTCVAAARMRYTSQMSALPRALGLALGAGRARLASVGGRLRPGLLDDRLRGARLALDNACRLIETLSPDATLARGYALVLDHDGRLLPDRQAVLGAGRVRIRLRDGEVPARTGPDGPLQGRLF